LDTEWLLSTLFDASLLSTSKAAGNGGSFFAPTRWKPYFRLRLDSRLRPRNDLFIIKPAAFKVGSVSVA
jgi:hypothetical protein